MPVDKERVQKAPVLTLRDTVHFPKLVTTLLVGRELSVKALQSSIQSNRTVVVTGQRDTSIDEPRAEDLHRVGVLSDVVQVMPLPDGTMRVVLRGITRVKIQNFQFRSGFFKANYSVIDELGSDGYEVEALRREAVEAFHQIAVLGKQIPIEVLDILGAVDDIGHLADLIADHLNVEPEFKQRLLEEVSHLPRLNMLYECLTKELRILELQSTIRTRVEKELGNAQREYFLLEQLKIIQAELSGGDLPFSAENEVFARKITACGMPLETQEKAIQELRRLERAPSSSPETMVIRTWIEWLISLPWNSLSDDRLDVKRAAEILDARHYGLTSVKDRILEYLAVRQLSGSLRGPILCFAGPPGVGKTSFGKSIADALGRKFVRVSLGGIRDEAEIRGHRRTYVGSLPGRIIQGVRQSGTRNPVFMLDEIDKMNMDLRGDPTSALLEALDPEQNAEFSDHYIEAPFDLSCVMFILTANMIDGIPAPLRDRMEIIQFPSYTEVEKIHIAKNFLLPRKIEEHGLSERFFEISDDTLLNLVRYYTREAGVRGLDRELATICRRTARSIAENNSSKEKISITDLEPILGKHQFRFGTRQLASSVGTATGMAYTEVGGDIITIESSLMSPSGDEPKITLTGSLGSVMRESALAAVTYVRSHQAQINPDRPFNFDVHIHVPQGAVPKDGPSAGSTIVTSLVSAYTNRPVRNDIAITGEITLQGNVLPVGGIREKVLGAKRAGIFEVVLPAENESDLADVPSPARDAMKFHLVENIEQLLAIVLQVAVIAGIGI